MRDREDRIAGPWVTRSSSPWRWNEGPCPCGGILRWAEAGYVPWHRICDRCGSHWDMYPIRVYIDRRTRTPYVLVPRPAGAEWVADGPGPGDAPPHVDRCDRCGDVVTDLEAGFCPSLGKMRCECGGRWRTVTGRVQYVPPETWDIVRQIALLIGPGDLTDEDVRRGVLYGGWARRVE
jgi:hypothetical protein